MIINIAVEAVRSYVKEKYSEVECKKIIKEISNLVNVELKTKEYKELIKIASYDELQSFLSKINEKESIRKKKGVYYTPVDVVKFIVDNCIKVHISKVAINVGIDNIDFEEVDCSILDPTCGAGEFVLYALEKKYDTIDKLNDENKKDLIVRAIASIFGNDINLESVEIAKIRTFLLTLDRYGIDCCIGLSKRINSQFTSDDFVSSILNVSKKYDIIVGNPPFVEDFKSGLNLQEKYGNIYANVLVNSAHILANNGSMGFVIPLSYISTKRMQKLRKKLMNHLPLQYIMSFADRPDCLFDGAHQKLCILIGKKCKSKSEIYTSHYLYWYKEERNRLLRSIGLIKNEFYNDVFIPKIGNPTDYDIYKKITDLSRMEKVYDLSREGEEKVYLNRRETFWMKAYRQKINDPDYKIFSFENALGADYCYCLINSSLFWWYWICVSDCWHVSKDLNGFMTPGIPQDEIISKLAHNLMYKLEETKVYVGTKQTSYEYKHKLCLQEIHAIDDYINKLYGLTENEGEYIKNYALRYRTSGGAKTRECH